MILLTLTGLVQIELKLSRFPPAKNFSNISSNEWALISQVSAKNYSKRIVIFFVKSLQAQNLHLNETNMLLYQMDIFIWHGSDSWRQNGGASNDLNFREI